MSKNVPITLACGDYEITRALKDGTVRPAGIDLTVVNIMDAATRHWRFMHNREFDMAETSSGSYVVARDQGLPFAAIPVFLHRRFRHGFFFINAKKGIRKPTDLIGRKMGCKSFSTSALIWQRGILEHEYGVPHKSIEWFSELEEEVPFEIPPDLKLRHLRPDQSIEEMMLAGELDGLLSPDVIEPLRNKDPRTARLFPNYKQEEIAYYRKTGVFPIMHVMGIKPEIVEKYPWVPITMFEAFEDAKALAMKRMANPRIVPLAWYREAWEEQEEIMGPDPWEYGLTDRNRKTLEIYLGYFREQGLIRRLPSLDELFINVAQGLKRGRAYRDRL